MALTIVAGQAPATGHTLHASWEVVSGVGHAHGGHSCVHLGGAGQLDEQDVVVDGVAVVVGVLEHLTGSDTVVSGKLGEEAVKRGEAIFTHLADPHHLDVLLVGGAVVFTEDHAVRRPEGRSTRM